MTTTLPEAALLPPEADLDGGRSLNAWLSLMRAHNPVVRGDCGSVHVFRHADVVRCLTAQTSVRLERAARHEASKRPPTGAVPPLDPAGTHVIRRLAHDLMHPGLGVELQPYIARLTSELVAGTAGQDRIDLMADIAHPLPVQVFCTLLGVPPQDYPLFQSWAEDQVRHERAAADPNGGSHLINLQLLDYLEQPGKTRAVWREDAPLSWLLSPQGNAGSGDVAAAIRTAATLLRISSINTFALLAGMALEFDASPATAAFLRAHRSAIPALIDEVARRRPAVLHVERVLDSTLPVADHYLGKGTRVKVWLLSANRDERVFHEPDTLRLHRPNSGQTATDQSLLARFGARLARLQAEGAFNTLLDAYAHLEVDELQPVRFYSNSTNIFGPRQLPLWIIPSTS